MTLGSIWYWSRRLAQEPRRELRRLYFRTLLARRAPHPIVCVHDGLKLNLSSGSVLAESLYVGSGFEDRELRCMLSNAGPGMTVFDIGANIGLYSILLGRAVGASGRVWGFEPYPPVASYFKQNIIANSLGNVTMVDRAVSDREGNADFYVFDDGQDVYNSLGAAERPAEGLRSTKRIKVPVTCLDTFAAEAGISSIDLLKVDVEGAEEKVLRGGQHLLKQSKGVLVLVEAYPPSAEQCECSVPRMVEMMTNWGFSAFEVSDDGGLVRVDGNLIRGTSIVFRRSVGR
jgi:FkbM family methyltransferase